MNTCERCIGTDLELVEVLHVLGPALRPAGEGEWLWRLCLQRLQRGALYVICQQKSIKIVGRTSTWHCLERKEQPAALSCCEGCADCAPGNTAKEKTTASEGPSVKILGSGCAKCNTLEASTKAALAQLGMDTSIDHVTDFSKIAAYGVMTTPALVVDGKVVSFGKVLKPDEVAAILRKARG